MQTRYFETLIRAVEAGSFSRAAEALHITQSAVSQRIKFLEEHYGHQLLDRSGAALVPTEAGAVVLERARTIVAKEREIRAELARFDGEKRLSLCCTPTFGMAYLPRVVNDFVLRNSDVADLKFAFAQTDQALKGLQGGEFELAVIEHCSELDGPYDICPLPDDELVFISAPSLGIPELLEGPRELLAHRLYARRDGCSSKAVLRESLAAAGVEFADFSTVVVSDDLRFSIEAVQEGGGISFVSRSLVEDRLASGALCAHRVEGFRHLRHRSLVLPKRRRSGDAVAPVLASFRECVSAVFAAP